MLSGRIHDRLWVAGEERGLLVGQACIINMMRNACELF